MTVIGNQMAEDLRRCCQALEAERDQLRTRVQELGAMARENRSRAVVELEAELHKLRADARRYQWLRDRAEIDYSINGTRVLAPIPRPSANLRTTAAELDDAIDQAMSTTTAEGGDGGA
jgi:hypothetical protein